MTGGASLPLAIACALAAACVAPQAGREPRPAETPGALATPEPDPACRGTVQGMLARNGLETVTVKLSVDARGRVEWVDVLSPDLTPAARLELQRAVASCLWAPRAPAARDVFTTTWVREVDAR